MLNFPMDSYNSCSICHTQSKHILATFIYDMTPTDTAELSPQRRQEKKEKKKKKEKTAQKTKGVDEAEIIICRMKNKPGPLSFPLIAAQTTKYIKACVHEVNSVKCIMKV